MLEMSLVVVCALHRHSGVCENVSYVWCPVTPAQMLARLPPERPSTKLEWEPVERTAAIIVPNGGFAPAELLFQEQSLSLMQGKCPTCHAPIAPVIDSDNWVYFRCSKNPAYHEWRRSLAFISKD